MWTRCKQKEVRELFVKWKWKVSRDPISLQSVTTEFIIIRNEGVYRYDANVLFEYVSSTGDYFDPICRIEYNDCELLRLSHTTGFRQNFLRDNKLSFLNNRQAYFTRLSLCNVIENEMNEQLETLQENVDFEFYQTVFLPIVIQCFENLLQIDTDICKLCIQRFRFKLKHRPIAHMQVNFYLRNLFDVFLHNCYLRSV